VSLPSLVACLAQKKGKISGKKAFQKYMYFLDAKGIPNPLTFRIHHYGPYSYELDYQTDNLELIGAIELSNNGSAYIITPGSNAQKLVEADKEFIAQYEPEINDVLNMLPETPLQLELWSTVHFVARSLNTYYEGASKQKVVEEVKKIKKDKFSLKEIQEALETMVEKKLLVLNSSE